MQITVIVCFKKLMIFVFFVCILAGESMVLTAVMRPKNFDSWYTPLGEETSNSALKYKHLLGLKVSVANTLKLSL